MGESAIPDGRNLLVLNLAAGGKLESAALGQSETLDYTWPSPTPPAASVSETPPP